MRFRVRGGLGDDFAMTALAREAKREMPDELIRIVQPRRPEIWDNNPHVNHGNKDNGQLVEVRIQMNEDKGNIAFSYGLQAGIEMKNTTPEIFLSESEIQWGILKVLKLEGIKPIIAIDTGANWAARRWEESRWVLLGERLQKWANVVEVGVPGKDHYGFPRHQNIPTAHQLLNLSIRESAAVIAAADLYIGNDSGCFHLASATGTQTILLCGVKGKTAIAYEKTIAIEGSKPCAPACKELCRRLRVGYVPPSPKMYELLSDRQLRAEAKKQYHFCMEDISIDQVENAAKKAVL